MGLGLSTRAAGGLWGRALLFAALVLGASVAERAVAQISPGALSAAHAELEGSGNCLECHAQRKGVDRSLCLECHETLRERIDAGLGLHARGEYEECATCHIEHHGREFELVWWGDAGETSFNHELAGYSLVGAHERVSCRGCHRAESITAGRRLLNRRKELDRTFLGLDTACLSCHQDEHRNQVEPDSCLSCHTMEAWLPASLFDHDRTRFALTGRHRDLVCSDCHAMLDAPEEAGEQYLGFSVAAFGQCSDCHRDPHQGRLGNGCAECHGTAGWRSLDRGVFDHDRTRFSLLGRHAEVDCQGCHRPGAPMRVERFESCVDCHEDAHMGQFEARPDGGGACESCHEVRGFRPSTFGLERHQDSSYPLDGAHLAVPCLACHEQVDAGRLAQILGRARPGPGDGSATHMRFRFESTSCHDCHADPHRDEVRQLVAEGGCESCHSLDGWRAIEFDHESTGFSLRGGHVGPVCNDCHPSIESPPTEARIQLTGAATACAGCHRDPHEGQFTDPAGETACESCHTENRWTELLFDHQVDSAFVLEGAHLEVECRECHLREAGVEGSLVRFKPLGTSCESCHAEVASGGGGAAS